MKKLFIIPLWIISIYISVLLSISVALTQKEFHSFVLKLYLDLDVSFKVAETNWHPIKPSVALSDLHAKGDQNIFADKIFIEFSLLNFLGGNFISRLSINEIVIQNQFNTNEDSDLFSFISSLRAFKELNISSLQINLPDETNLLNLSILSSFDKNRPILKLNLQDEETNILEVGILPSENSNGQLFQGYIKTNKYKINKNLINSICGSCDFDTQLRTQVNFTFFQQKLVSLKGNLDLTLDKNLLGFNSISSSFQLRDNKDNAIQVSTFLNKDIRLRVPDFFINYSKKEKKLIFPEVNLSENKLVESFIKERDIELSLEGVLNNVVINLDTSKENLKAKVQGIEIKHPSMHLQGLSGQISISREKGEFFITSPLLKASSSNFLDESLEFFDFNSFLNFNWSRDNFEVNPSSFSAILEDQQIEGLISFMSIPTEGYGDINLRIRSEKITDKSALSLFPNTTYLASTKEGIDSLIDCGFFEDVSLIYRGPLDGRYLDNSGSFVMRASGRDICLNLNDYKIFGVDSDFSVNNFNVLGKLKNGKFFDSEVAADFKTYKFGSTLFLNVDGTSTGPFSSLFGLFSNNLGEMNSGGFHETKFLYTSPIKKEISLLDKSSKLEIKSKIEKGELNALDFGLSLKNIFSSLSYNSETGFDEGYVSLKLNSTPLVFDLDLESKDQDYSFFVSEKPIQLKKLAPIRFKDSISGSSTTLIQVAIPSLIRGRDIKRSYLGLASNLMGTEINLPDPFFKSQEDVIDLEFIFYPSFSDKYSRLQFRLGEIIRGKLNVSSQATEGFVIAGRKKQSITIEEGKISLIGSIEKLDLSIISLFDQSIDGKKNDIEIKSLEINEVVLSSFSLPKTILKSKNSKQFLDLSFSNRNFSGHFYLPKIANLVPIIDLDFIKLSLSKPSSDSTFSDIFNNLSTKFKFKTKSLILNSIEYGDWAFDVTPSDSSLILDNIVGTYGKWGLTKNENNISRLNILKTGMGWRSLLESKIYSGSPEKAFTQIGINPNFEMDTIFIETNLSWQSLPWEFDYAKVVGDIYFEIEGLLIQNREDLDAQNNILRLVNIFNVTDSFEKVTNLDFRKLYKTGFSADSVNGSLLISRNTIELYKPLLFKSGSSEFEWKGQIGRDEKGYLDSLALEVIMTLPLREYLPAYAFLLGGPVTAGVVYIAGKAFERNLDQISSGSWSITGTLKQPKTEFKGWFEESKK